MGASGSTFATASSDLRFAASVAGFGMLLRGSQYRGSWTLDDVARAETDSSGDEAERQAFVALVRRAGQVMGT